LKRRAITAQNALVPSRILVLAGALALSGLALSAQIPQGVFTETFPAEEFAAHRSQVIQAIGDGVAILQGAVERPAELPFRQGAQFFYLTGVEVPRAILLIDGRAKTSTLFIDPAGYRVRALGPSLTAEPEAAKITGLDAVVARDQFAAAVQAIGRDGRKVFTPFGSDVVGGGSRAEANGLETASKRDAWDGRSTRPEAFMEKLRASSGRADLVIENLDPIVDRARAIKTPREVVVIREATRIAGVGIMEAMREAEPGMYEYELQAVAEYVFKKYGSQGPAYFALVATGPNMVYSHYHKGTRRLAAGDLVQFDYAPDFQYYVSDVTRVFPANGKFTPIQREFYSIYLAMYRALISEIRPNVPVRDLLQAAGRKMDAAIQATTFTSANIRSAAQAFADRYKNSQGSSFGHSIGLEVHDVGSGRPAGGAPVTLIPGQLFTIEPALQVPEEGLAMRLEDALLVTGNGVENLSAFVPLEIAAIEKLMAEPGISALIKSRKGGRP
jgi:Xaa-Pro aminopeptidase